MKKLDDLLNNVQFDSIFGKIDKEISGIAYNSKKCIDNSAFVAIKGIETDGHNYIDSAINNGATVIFCEILPQKISENITYIKCLNTRMALAELAHAFFNFPAKKLKIIGITGTNGKTTISFLLKSIFENAGFNTAIIGTTGIYFNNQFQNSTHTTPESLELAEMFDNLYKNNVEFVFMEVSSHALALNRTHNIDFIGAIFTNLSLDHLDYHKNMEDYASAKKILFENMQKSGLCVLNGDDNYAKFMIDNISNTNFHFVGRKNGEVLINDEELNLDYSRFKMNGTINLEIKTKLLGSFNIENCAISATFASLFGIDHQIIKDALENSDGAPGRMQKVILKNGAIGLVDYAHTPDALEKAIKSCRNALLAGNHSSKVLCVFGCGGDRDKSKRPIMGEISASLADYTIITSDNPRTENPIAILNDIMAGIDKKFSNKVEIIEDRAEAIKKAIQNTSLNDIILIAGKGHENYQIIGKEKFHFDDVEQLKNS